MPFGKGSRGCLGKEFALVSLYPGSSLLLYYFDLVLFETTGDIEMAHEMFAPFPAADAKGARMLVA